MTIVGGAALLAGCPIYPDNNSPYYAECQTNYDCPTGYACNSVGSCENYGGGYASEDASAAPCGACPNGTVCALVSGTIQCVAPGTIAEDAGESSDGSTIGDGGAGDGSFSLDAAGDATPVSDGGTSPARACNADAQCAGTAGSRCIDGLCTALGQLCSDGTQCFGTGDACVDGVCVPTCSGAASGCPTGYACDFNRGVCSVNPAACSAGTDCQGGAVCVETRCVAPCLGDAGVLAPGLVCVNGGIIPDEQARFTCQNDGASGAVASSCDADSVCLHGDCYPACDGDGGGCSVGGQSCKAVTIAKGTFEVCGADGTLGSDCDPAVGRACAGTAVCINGSCK
jgi:hypothetical protein